MTALLLLLVAATGGVSELPAEEMAKAHATARSCIPCHTESGWVPAKFVHDRTGFPLVGGHKKARCRACHGASYETKVEKACVRCHTDVHAQQFGMRCKGCHSEDSWQPRFDSITHRATNFPLTGGHAFLPCEECHATQRGLTFSKNALSCDACHLKEYSETATKSVDHRASNFSLSCRTCHQPTNFRPARFPDHDECFDLTFSVHSFVKCSECHTSVARLVSSGDCKTETMNCASCHTHRCEVSDREHDEVVGYECESNKCAQCHQTF